MDWRVMITTFGVIFLAEMGDKTQLAAMTMAAESKKPLAVLIGASLALAWPSEAHSGIIFRSSGSSERPPSRLSRSVY